MSTEITESVALRLGLAAKAVPQISLKKFIHELINELGQPVTEKKLRSLNPKKLFNILSTADRDIERGQSNQVYAILTSADITTMKAPELPESIEVKGPKLRVAISSNNNEQLDGHFGSCLRFLIYDVNETEWKLVDIRAVATDESGLLRTNYLVDLIRDCHVLSTLSIGGPAAAKVVRADITPIKKLQPTSVDEILKPLTDVIRTTPPPWLAKILEKQETADAC